MPIVTQRREQPGKYQEKFDAVKKQMMSNDAYSKNFTEAEIDVMIKDSLIKEAEDKMEFSLRGEIRRGRHVKRGMDDESFSKLWKSKMKDRLKQDGFVFVLTPTERKTLAKAKEKVMAKKTEEMTRIASEAMKKVLLNN